MDINKLNQINEIYIALPMFIIIYLGILFLLQLSKNDNKINKQLKKYIEKYPINRVFNQIETEINDNSYVMENTPIGNVLMKYCNNEEGFLYWSDKTVPYKFLEVVARKYVLYFNCKSKFIENKIIENNSDNTENKSNNIENKSDNIEITEISKNVFDSDVFIRKNIKNRKINNKKTNKIVNKKSTKFIRKGYFSEFNFLPIKKVNQNESKLSYKDFLLQK